MKAILRTLTILLAGASLTMAGGDAWLTDFDKAKEQAKKDDKAILIDFTGSDWCGWCIKLDQEVFSKQEFLDYAGKKFVLVEIDFPRKEKLSDEQKKQNEALAKKFGVEGFPTIILTDAKGRKFATTGYQEGGPQAYIEHLDKLLERKGLD